MARIFPGTRAASSLADLAGLRGLLVAPLWVMSLGAHFSRNLNVRPAHRLAGVEVGGRDLVEGEVPWNADASSLADLAGLRGLLVAPLWVMSLWCAFFPLFLPKTTLLRILGG